MKLQRYSLRTIDVEAFRPVGGPIPAEQLLAIADNFNFDLAPDIGDRQGWVWSEDDLTGDNSGWSATQEQVEALIEEEYFAFISEVNSSTEELVEEEEDLPVWQRAIALTIATAIVALFMFGIGGRRQMSDENEVYARDRIRRGMRYFSAFGEEIADGNLSEAQIRARARYYIDDARLEFDQAQREAYQKAGFLWERSLLSQSEHCNLCVEMADLGWSPIGSLIPKGERDCLFNCKCSWRFSRSITRPSPSDGMRTILLAKFGWVG